MEGAPWHDGPLSECQETTCRLVREGLQERASLLASEGACRPGVVVEFVGGSNVVGWSDALPFYLGPRFRRNLIRPNAPRPNACNGLCLRCGHDLNGKVAHQYHEGVVAPTCDKTPDPTAHLIKVERAWDFTVKENVPPHV